jgi:lysophospholipase L1-like esterase
MVNMKRKKKISYYYYSQSSENFTDIASGATGIWSTWKLNPDYTGPGIKIKRASNNAETDIDFSGNRLSASQINSFTNNGAIAATVSIVYDQSGNGYDLTVQATKNPADLYYDSYHNNYFLRFKTTGGNVGYENTAFPLNTRDFTLFRMTRGKTAAAGQEMFAEFGTSLAFYRNDFNSWREFDSASKPWTQRNIIDTVDFGVMAIRNTATNRFFNYDKIQTGTASGAVDAATPTGIRVGIWSAATPATDAKYDWSGIVIYASQLTDQQITDNISALHERFSKTVAYTKYVGCVGDSLTEGRTPATGLNTDEGWVIGLKRQYDDTIRVVNSGYSGRTAVQMNTNVATQATNMLALGVYSRKVAIVWPGINDLDQGATAATLATSVQTLITSLKGGGSLFDRVILVDLIPRSDFSASENAEKATYNADAAANYASWGADAFYQASVLAWDFGTHYNADGIHLNPTGANLFLNGGIKTILDTQL